MAKSIEDSFTDWEADTFGFGYGTGESHTLAALKGFFNLVGQSRDNPNAYDYRVLEAGLGPQIAWLMINILGHADIIEYGTSPRFGWLTGHGERLRAFVTSKTVDELYALTSKDQDYIHCYPKGCNCGETGYEAGRHCDNPFWAAPR